VWISFIFNPVKFASAQLTLYLSPFPVSGVGSLPANITMLPWHVTLLSHGAKMRSLSPLHLSETLHHVVSPLEPKLKY
jgi:hypothetical protein